MTLFAVAQHSYLDLCLRFKSGPGKGTGKVAQIDQVSTWTVFHSSPGKYYNLTPTSL